MFRTILFFTLIYFSLGQTAIATDLPNIEGYEAPAKGYCVGPDPENLEPNYVELWFQEHPQNCTQVCDQLPTCSGISYTPSRFKLQCRIYIFRHIQDAIVVFPNDYLDEEYFWINANNYRGDSFHAVQVGGNDGLHCYIRVTEAPSTSPSGFPSTSPSFGPSVVPTHFPSTIPTVAPSSSPSFLPSNSPSFGPSVDPSVSPSHSPTTFPTTDQPTNSPTRNPTFSGPSTSPSVDPTCSPSFGPSLSPTTDEPSVSPTKNPTFEEPSLSPSFEEPSNSPTLSPTTNFPTTGPTKNPTTDQPSVQPTLPPSFEEPSVSPTTDQPSVSPTLGPSSQEPTVSPTKNPTFEEPTNSPSTSPSSQEPSVSPETSRPSVQPTFLPSDGPTVQPTFGPSTSPTTSKPSTTPSTSPSNSPTTPMPSTTPTVAPSFAPSTIPSKNPTGPPSCFPSGNPSTGPSKNPTGPPSLFPSVQPSAGPSVDPTYSPSLSPTTCYPSTFPTVAPSKNPTVDPTTNPSFGPTTSPTTDLPTVAPSKNPTTEEPSQIPSKSPTTDQPSNNPSFSPSTSPSSGPTQDPTTDLPTTSPTKNPTLSQPTVVPSATPTTDSPSTNPTSDTPTTNPTKNPTLSAPSTAPTGIPTTDSPSTSPSAGPTVSPTNNPSTSPSVDPTTSPSFDPSISPTNDPSVSPTTESPSVKPTTNPTKNPTTEQPSTSPTVDPTIQPTVEQPTTSPSMSPTSDSPSTNPSYSPSLSPTTDQPSVKPTVDPTVSPSTEEPSTSPSVSPSTSPTVIPTDAPSVDPTTCPSFKPSVIPTNAPSYSPTVMPSDLPSKVPSITSPCSIGKLNVLGSHFIYLDEDESFVDEDDLVFLALGIPERYTIEKVWPGDADTETGYYIDGGTNEFWSLGVDSNQECTQKITGGFPWSRIRTRELMGLTVVTDPTYYEEVDSGTYFHNVLTLELSESYETPDGWAKPGEEDSITRKVVYEIPWLILLQTEMVLTVDFTVVIPTPGPSTTPSVNPTHGPTVDPSTSPSTMPTNAPSSEVPTTSPSTSPSFDPSVQPTKNPTTSPSVNPTVCPSFRPTVMPSDVPSVVPSLGPSVDPTVAPTTNPSNSPTPRQYIEVSVTVRPEDTFYVRDKVDTVNMDPTQRFTQKEQTVTGTTRRNLQQFDAPGGFTFFGNPAPMSDISPDDLGLFQWYGANVTSDTSITWMVESANIRVRINILLLAPVDCTASFTEFSACSTTCGDGIISRTWIVTDFADAAGTCAHNDGYVDTEPCFVEVCPMIDEIVTRFAVYNPDLNENSTVCMNFTTITNLPWKTKEDGFSLVDPNNILNEDSAHFAFTPLEGCWPSWSYDEFDGLCGEQLPSGLVEHPTGMFIQLQSADDTICKEVCDYFAEDCMGWDFLPRLGFQPMICEVLGVDITQAHAEEANYFVNDGRTFDWYFDAGTQITGGYTFAERGAKCYRKGAPIYSGNCLQDFNMCFTMDFVCNLDEVFYLELQAENLVSGTEITRQFETRIATDASCAQIIGDVPLTGELQAFYDDARTESVVQFYKGNTIYFTIDINSYANVASVSLVKMEYVQSEEANAPVTEYPKSHATAIVMEASEVVPATQLFTTKGQFEMLVTDPVQGSVDGVYTKWTATLGVNFIDGRRMLVESEYNRNIRAEINTLIYPPRCSNPEADPGDTLTQACDEGQRILWCDENGQWVMLVNNCGDDVPVHWLDSTEAPQQVTRIIQSGEDDTFMWRTSAIAIGVSLCAACCVYYLLVCRKRKDKHVAFFEDPDKEVSGVNVETQVGEEDESSSLGSEYSPEVPSGGIIKRTPMGDNMPTPYGNEHDPVSAGLGTDFNTKFGKDINSDIDQDMKAAIQVFNELGLHDVQDETPATPV